MRFAAPVLFLFTLALSVVGRADDETAQKCVESGLVSLKASNIEIRTALKAIATQGDLNVAIDNSVRGQVTAALKCAEPKQALRQVASQVGAAFCEEDRVIRVYRVGRYRCEGALTLPFRIDRVSGKH